MTYEAKMKEIKFIQNHINKIPKGLPFAMKSIEGQISYTNLRQILSRLVKTGEVMRATRGIYVRPKELPYLGKVLPEPEEIIKTIAQQTGEIIALHGAEAAHRLNLSTQVPIQPIFYTTGNSRRIKLGNLEIILKHISPSKLVNPGTVTCLVISALWYLGKHETNQKIIKKIKQRIKPEEFLLLLKHTKNMPAWMSELFKPYK